MINLYIKIKWKIIKKVLAIKKQNKTLRSEIIRLEKKQKKLEMTISEYQLARGMLERMGKFLGDVDQ